MVPSSVGWNCLELVVVAGSFERIESMLSLGTGRLVEELDVSLLWVEMVKRFEAMTVLKVGIQTLVLAAKVVENKVVGIPIWTPGF